MSHLEDLWAQFPTSKPPVAAIVAASAGPSRVRTRVGAAIIAASALAAGVVVATTVSSHPGTAGPTTPIEYAAFQADLKPATSCDALLVSYKKRAMEKVTEWGWNGGGYYPYYGGYYGNDDVINGLASRNFSGSLGAMPNGALAPLRDQLQMPGTQGAPMAQSAELTNLSAKLLTQTNSATGTNVQEMGVDEPDAVKTNGTLVTRIDGNTLAVFDASGDEVKPRGTIALPYLNNGSILMSGSTVIATGYDSNPSAAPTNDGGSGGTRVTTVSLSDPDHPSITGSVVFAGGGITALRQQGTTVRMVINTGFPQLQFVHPVKDKITKEQAIATNKHLVAMTTFKDWIPTYDAGQGTKQLLPCTHVAVPPAGVPLGTTSIVSFDIGSPTTLNAVGVTGTLTNAYESQHNLYLTVGSSSGGCWARICPAANAASTTPTTTILQFALDGAKTTHVATGTIDGMLQDSWSMDEWAGILRVVVTRFGAAQNHDAQGNAWNREHENVIETLVPHDKVLVGKGILAGLGKNQTLTAARWFDNLAIISTANQVDPLYTVDLSDPANPKQLGALHLPGQTQYIHPIASNRFMTISIQSEPAPTGEDPNARRSYTQVATFDITDPAKVRQIGAVSVGPNTWSLAARDPKNFTWLPDRRIALSAFQGPKNTVLGVFNAADTYLTQSQIPLPGNHSGARTFAVANGKVVLVNGGSITFLNL